VSTSSSWDYGGDWLEVDTSELPTNQLPLLQSMLGRRLVNIQRSIWNTELDPEVGSFRFASLQEFFRKAWGPVIIEMKGLPLIYLYDSKYYRYEISIGVSTEPLPMGAEVGDLARRYTLNDSQYVDDRLLDLPGQCLLKMRILIRKPHLLPRDKAQALQDGIEMTFENGTTIIISYYLNKLQAREFQILYPEEIPWKAVEYVVDVSRPRISWRYRFNYWKWRALERLGRQLDLH
jgi:hypothetical protein